MRGSREQGAGCAGRPGGGAWPRGAASTVRHHVPTVLGASPRRLPCSNPPAALQPGKWGEVSRDIRRVLEKFQAEKVTVGEGAAAGAGAGGGDRGLARWGGGGGLLLLAWGRVLLAGVLPRLARAECSSLATALVHEAGAHGRPTNSRVGGSYF